MKKYITTFTILFLTLFAFVSCDTDATNGILSEIVNSETEEDFELIAVSANDNASIIYSVEDDGIYLYQSDTTSLERTLILDTSDYLNVLYLYLDYTNNRLWFDYYDLIDSTTYLAYLNTNDFTQDPTTVSYNGTFIEITSNGYVIAKDTSTYYAFDLDGYTSGTVSASVGETFGSSTDSLDDTIVVDDDTIIVQTVEIIDEDDDKNEFTFYIYDGKTPIYTGSTTLDYKVVAAVEETAGSGKYFFVTSDASLYSYDINALSDKLTQLFENDDDDYYFNMESQKMFVNGQYIVVFDEDLYVLCYDIDESDYAELDADDLYLSEGFANTLSSTSDIVGIFPVDNDSNNFLDDNPNKYAYYCYVATNENGYYFVGMDTQALSDDDSDYSESESLSFTLVTE
ncbi:MAG: hypothetical protein PQJ45_09220 [Sphaerochaetaceae bacterium]|nr:hypothetical protein [Sphaerochaetaceae bacterium]